MTTLVPPDAALWKSLGRDGRGLRRRRADARLRVLVPRGRPGPDRGRVRRVRHDDRA
ncbi:hypothetical protein G5V59_21405 [Nocardioides sp. W3-2-3]|uniref:hypothetical protein n=1 Tax=Nocardioides convexus TaxID=2712224 RepID=UPI0024184A35|nr:hypothetical protein [Nocardioides convexus]NHA01494.1 hypothetical protein [Nocardioides convexus]